LRVKFLDITVSPGVKNLDNFGVKVEKLLSHDLILLDRIVFSEFTHIVTVELVILHIERNEFVDVHDHFLVILLLFDTLDVLIVFWGGYRRHHMFVIQHVVFFISLLFIQTNQVLLMITHPRSLNAR